MENFLENIHEIAPVIRETVQAAYRFHFTLGGIHYHASAARGEGQRIWRAKKDNLVKNGEHAYMYDDVELHELYVNSLFQATEIHDIAKHFLENYGIKIVVTRQAFPVPLIRSYSSLQFSEKLDDSTIITVGDPAVPPPKQFLAFLYDTVGTNNEIWTENLFDKQFTARNRIQIMSLIFAPEKDDLPLDFPIYAYAEPKCLCLFDDLKDVPYQIESHRASEE